MRAPWAVRTLLSILVAVPVATGCRSSSTGLDAELRGVPNDTVITLRLGQVVRAPDIMRTIAFLAVRHDSRCPTDVVCVWQGNAEVEIRVAFGEGPTVPYVLNTGLEPRSANIGPYLLTLVDLRPAPVSTTSIPPEQYVVSLRLQALVGPGAGQAAAGVMITFPWISSSIMCRKASRTSLRG